MLSFLSFSKVLLTLGKVQPRSKSSFCLIESFCYWDTRYKSQDIANPSVTYSIWGKLELCFKNILENSVLSNTNKPKYLGSTFQWTSGKLRFFIGLNFRCSVYLIKFQAFERYRFASVKIITEEQNNDSRSFFFPVLNFLSHVSGKASNWKFKGCSKTFGFKFLITRVEFILRVLIFTNLYFEGSSAFFFPEEELYV